MTQQELDNEVSVLESQLDIVDVISQYLPLKKKEGLFVGECCFCEKGKLWVFPNKQKWNCGNCHPVQWGLLGFLCEVGDDGLEDGLQSLRNWANKGFDIDIIE